MLSLPCQKAIAMNGQWTVLIVLTIDAHTLNEHVGRRSDLEPKGGCA